MRSTFPVVSQEYYECYPYQVVVAVVVYNDDGSLQDIIWQSQERLAEEHRFHQMLLRQDLNQLYGGMFEI